MTDLWIFLCIYPILYTPGLCDVTYIRLYNTYLHSKCFLSALYNDMICLAPSQLMLLFVSSSDSILYAYTIFRSSSLHTDQRHTFQQKYRVLHVCMCSEHMQHPCSFPLEGQCCECSASSRLELGRSWTWSAPWSAANYYIFVLQMDSQFTEENFMEIFVRHFAATWLVYKKCV